MTQKSIFDMVEMLGCDNMLTLLTALINFAIAVLTLYAKLNSNPKKKASKRRKRLKTKS